MRKNVTEKRNSLDGLAILRFAHAFETGGGIEQYIEDLDMSLLKRNKINIIRMYLSYDVKNATEQIRKNGEGSLTKVPLHTEPSAQQNDADKQKTEASPGNIIKALLRDWVVYNPFLYNIVFKKIVRRSSTHSQSIEALDAQQKAEDVFKNLNIDLVVMHYAGGRDSEAIINVARAFKTPYVFLNHFSNDRFNHMSIREQIIDAAGIAGVSSVDVPKRLRSTFFNLSDGIDTEIFKPLSRQPINVTDEVRILILPARIVMTKGQSDLIKACAMLKKQGFRVKIVLAGRSDSLKFEEQLKRQARELNVIEDVLFVGQLNREQLINWYAASAILAFPTYHHEGLPRILMEAQSMEVPPVAYDVGGMSEGILQGKTGYLVPKGNIMLFTERLKELLMDENKRKKMGKEGRQFVQERFSLDVLARRHEQYYMRIIKEYSSRETIDSM